GAKVLASFSRRLRSTRAKWRAHQRPAEQESGKEDQQYKVVEPVATDEKMKPERSRTARDAGEPVGAAARRNLWGGIDSFKITPVIAGIVCASGLRQRGGYGRDGGAT